MGFSADWLALREPADAAARDGALLAQAALCAGPDARVVDLGSGTGATVRAFEAASCVGWQWRFVDEDAALLAMAVQQHPGAMQTRMNLREVEDLPLDEASLVTASALLDLMPEAWMERFAARLESAAVPFYAALSYDGVMRWQPELEGDAAITRFFNHHQQTDKGIGIAMGPNAGQRAAETLTDHGFDVTVAQSPWRLGPEQAALHRELVEGIGAAAQEIGMAEAGDWVEQRMACLETSTVVIGHTDLLAVPRNTS